MITLAPHSDMYSSRSNKCKWYHWLKGYTEESFSWVTEGQLRIRQFHFIRVRIFLYQRFLSAAASLTQQKLITDPSSSVTSSITISSHTLLDEIHASFRSEMMSNQIKIFSACYTLHSSSLDLFSFFFWGRMLSMHKHLKKEIARRRGGGRSRSGNSGGIASHPPRIESYI